MAAYSLCRGVVHAYTSIWRVEGLVTGLYRGTLANIARYCTVLYCAVLYCTLANIARNAIVNVGETVVYDAVKGGGARCGEGSEACVFLKGWVLFGKVVTAAC